MAIITHSESGYRVEFQPRPLSASQQTLFRQRLDEIEQRGAALVRDYQGGKVGGAKSGFLLDTAKLLDDMLTAVMPDVKLSRLADGSRALKAKHLFLFGMTSTSMAQHWHDVVTGGRYLRTAETILGTLQETGDEATLELFAHALRQPLMLEREVCAQGMHIRLKSNITRESLLPVIDRACERIDALSVPGAQVVNTACDQPLMEAVVGLDRALRKAGYAKGLGGIAPELAHAPNGPQAEAVGHMKKQPLQAQRILQQVLSNLPICMIRGVEGAAVKISPPYAQEVLGATERLWNVLNGSADFTRPQQEVIGNALRSAKAMLGTKVTVASPLLDALNGVNTALQEVGYTKGLRGLAPELLQTRRGPLRVPDAEQWNQSRTQNVKVLRGLLGGLVLQRISDDELGAIRVTPDGVQKVREAVATLVRCMEEDKPFSRVQSEALRDAFQATQGAIAR